jgi:hypothetical protein
MKLNFIFTKKPSKRFRNFVAKIEKQNVFEEDYIEFLYKIADAKIDGNDFDMKVMTEWVNRLIDNNLPQVLIIELMNNHFKRRRESAEEIDY